MIATAQPAPAESVRRPDADALWFQCCHEVRLASRKDDSAKAGRIERAIQARSREALRELARGEFQAAADACPPRCPKCGTALIGVERVPRTILTQWGQVTIERAYGRCPKCGVHCAPADVALGLEERASSSPDTAEKLAWLATKLPAAEAAEVFEHMTGQEISPSRVERVLKQKGEEALERRERDIEQAISPADRAEFSRRHASPDEPEAFTLVLALDGWMMRERDEWGHTEELRAKGKLPKRWHEVRSARLFRLDQRSRTQSERAVLLDSHSVATRGSVDQFGRQLWTEAVRMGLLRAKRVLIVADGGVWIWHLAGDRFSFAEGTLDYYHASQHLWAVAHALHGESGSEARDWVQPLLHQLKHGEHGKVLATLEELADKPPHEAIADLLRREFNYFDDHREHIDYRRKADRGEPIGSGSVESLCKQFQLRFKRNGQFWSTPNGESLLELVNLRRNGRWATLWPHLQSDN